MDVRLNLHPPEYTALAQYNDRLEERRHPFVVVPLNQSIPTPSQCAQLRRQAGLCSHPDDVPDSEFFGYNPSGSSDDEGAGEAPPRHSPTPHTSSETASGSGSVEAEA